LNERPALEGWQPRQIAERLAPEELYVWDGIMRGAVFLLAFLANPGSSAKI
jgi:hypothetical protein